MSEEKPDQRYDEAAVRRMAILWAQMYKDLVAQGVPGKHAVQIVMAWLYRTLA